MPATVQGIEFEIRGSAETAVDSISKLSNALTKLQKLSTGDTGLKRMATEVKEFAKSLSTLKNIKSLSDLSSAVKGITSFANAVSRLSADPDAIGRFASNMSQVAAIDYTNLTAAATAIRDIMSATRTGSTNTSGISRIGESASSSAPKVRRLAGAFDTLRSKMKSIAGLSMGGLFNSLKWSASGLLGPVRALGNAVSGLANRFKRLLIMRTFRAIIRAVTQAFKEGINNLYQYSHALGSEFAASMDQCSTSVQYLKNSLGAMVAPIVNSLAPALDFIIDKIVTFLNVLNQLMARLGGASYWTKAKKAATSYGGAVSDAIGGAGGAAKEALKYLAPFDEINKFDSDSSGGGGGGGGGGGSGTDYGEMFEEMVAFNDEIANFADMLKEAWENADFTEVGQLIGEKLTTALENINWESIKATCNRIAQSLATFINGFVETPGLWTALGKTIGEGINTAIGMWNTFFDTTHFESIGSGIAEALNALFDPNKTGSGFINPEELGRALSQKIRAAIDAAYGFLVGGSSDGGFDFKNFGTWLGNAINGFFENIDLSKAGTALATAVTGAIDGAIAFLQTTNWGDIASNIVGGISSTVSGISSWFSDTDWDQLGTDIYEGIKSAIENDVSWSTLATTFSTLAGNVLGATVEIAVAFVANAWKDLRQIWDERMAEYEGQTIEVAISFVVDLLSLPKNLKQKIDDNITTPFSNALRESLGIGEDSKVFSAGGLISEGLLSGMASSIPGVGAIFWLANIFNPIVDAIKSIFGIHSPAQEMKPLGEDIGAGLLEGIKNKFKSGLKSWVQTNVLDKLQGAIDASKDLVANVGATIQGVSGSVSDFVSSTISVDVQLIKRGWTSISSFVGTSVTTAVRLARSGWASISSFVGTSVTTFISLVRSGWSSISSFVGTWVTARVGLSKSGWSTITAFVGSWVGVFVSLIKSGWSSISSFVGSWVTVHISVVKGWLGSIADALGISTIWASLKVSVPKIGVSWGSFSWGKTSISYPKGFYTYYAHGGILNAATLLGFDGSGAHIGGEAGQEAILPLDRNTEWMDKIADRLASRLGGSGDVTVQVVLDGKVVAQTTADVWRSQARNGQNPLVGVV